TILSSRAVALAGGTDCWARRTAAAGQRAAVTRVWSSSPVAKSVFERWKIRARLLFRHCPLHALQIGSSVHAAIHCGGPPILLDVEPAPPPAFRMAIGKTEVRPA